VTTLSIENVTIAYGAVPAVRDVSCRVQIGEVVAIVGPNGAGKSTLANTIVGRMKPSSGSIRLGHEPITGLPPHKIVAKGLAVVPEGRLMIGVLTTEENLELGAMAKGLRVDRRPGLERVYELFPRLWERRDLRAGLLSGGEQQMVAIGRALMSEPVILVLDEPSLGLAPVVVDTVFDKITELAGNGLGILVVEQNARASVEIAHTVHVMRNGRIVKSSTASELASDTELSRLYTGGT
jgi:branched-chain amino acid transport system ATP-binding protein